MPARKATPWALHEQAYPEMTDAEFDAQERRLNNNFDVARQTLHRARANLDRIGDELRDLRIARREAQREQR